jgi:cAMP-dependent protein kinase regulator
MDTLQTISTMERVLFLRRVKLFANLTPVDLVHIAAIAREHLFVDGDVIAQQGDSGDEMYIIVSGEVGVINEHRHEMARRKPGDYVGEMAIISQQPRMATLVAAGDVRTLCIGQKPFEEILRGRFEISLAVMRELCERLKQSSVAEIISKS